MKKVSEDPKDSNSQTFKYNATRDHRKALQKEFDEEYKQGLDEIKTSIREYQAPDIKEVMLEERRKWIYDFYELNEGNDLPKKVTEFYEKDKVMKPLTPEEEEAKRKEEEDKKKEEKKKKDAKKNAKGKKAKKDTPEEEFLKARVWKGPTEVVSLMQEKYFFSLKVELILSNSVASFAKEWETYEEDRKNFEQKFDPEYAKQTVRPQVEEEVE